MHHHMKRKSISLIMSVIISMQLLTGCSNIFHSGDSDKCPYVDFIVVDVFDSLANYQGIQSGWFAKIVKDKFNMELNIIAPNIAGKGDNLFDIRASAGSVGDLIICDTVNGDLQDLVDEGLVLDMSDMLEDKNIMRYQAAISSLNEKLTQDGIFAIPSEISSKPATQSSEALELTFGSYLRWDIYAAIGYPKMSTLEDLLPVLKAMQKELPFTESGNVTYGFSFFKDWDDNMMTAAKQPACFYGYDEMGFVLAKADGTDYQSIIDSDSLYMRNLRLYNQANQLGLVDPDSMTQNYKDLSEKYKDGSILYSPWPWQCQSVFNTKDNTDQDKGYMLAPIDDMNILSYGCIQEGNQRTVMAIGSQAEDPDRLADFIDWLYSPEGIEMSCAKKSGGTAGPEGLTWAMGDDGPYLTDYGKKALYENDISVPEDWGSGTWDDGVSQLNYNPVSISDSDPNGYTYTYTLWNSVLKAEYTSLDIDWRTHLNTDAVSTRKYLEENNMIIIAPGASYVSLAETTDITTNRSLCQTIITDYSWKMVFAQSDDRFYNLYNEMLKKLKTYGYKDVLKKDLQDAKNQDLARKQAAAKASN